MKEYDVILNVVVKNGTTKKVKTYNLIVESASMATVESAALSTTGNTGASDYTISVSERS